jgi:FMN-dependent NADH-azoreductase
MTQILYIKSSPRGDASYSSRVADHAISELQRVHPDAQVVERDLAQEKFFHLDGAYLRALGQPEAERPSPQREQVAHADTLIDELLAADVVVIAVSMINFAVPSTLKAWIDQVTRAGKTFRYDESGTAHGFATGKRVILVQAHGGRYCNTDAQSNDFVTPYLQHMLGFLGMTDVEIVHVEGTVFGEEAAEQAVIAGIERARSVAVVAALALAVVLGLQIALGHGRRVGERMASTVVIDDSASALLHSTENVWTLAS